MEIDKKQVVAQIRQACRNRKATHLLLSQYAYDIYKASLNRDSRRKGVEYATCHGVALLPLDWFPREVLIAFYGRDRPGRLILAGVRAEDRGIESVLAEFISQGLPTLFLSRLPEKKPNAPS